MKIIVDILALSFLLLTASCGTTTGNALVGSASFNTSGNTFVSIPSALSLYEVFAATNVSSMKFCVKKIQLIDENDSVRRKNDDEEIDFMPGLIDVSNGREALWGYAEVPVDFNLKKIWIHIRKDELLCNVDYAFKFNDFTSDNNIVLKWKYNPAIELNSGDTITLDLSAVVGNLRTSADSGSLSSNTLKEAAQGAEGSAQHTKKKKKY